MRKLLTQLENSRAHLFAAQMLILDERGDDADRHLALAERLYLLRGDRSELGARAVPLAV
jgi:hypothetical protein